MPRARRRPGVDGAAVHPHGVVARAVRKGALPPIGARVCVDCGARARYYHHPGGYQGDAALEVVPVCPTCHAKRRHEHDGFARSLERINVELYPDELAGVREAKAWAMRRGQSFREFVLEALGKQVAELERLAQAAQVDGRRPAGRGEQT